MIPGGMDENEIEGRSYSHMKIDLVYADSGDWVGVYVDGVCVRQTHSLQEDELLSALNIDYKVHYDVPVDGYLPRTIDEVELND
jgi:hypothetical protein